MFCACVRRVVEWILPVVADARVAAVFVYGHDSGDFRLVRVGATDET